MQEDQLGNPETNKEFNVAYTKVLFIEFFLKA